MHELGNTAIHIRVLQMDFGRIVVGRGGRRDRVDLLGFVGLLIIVCGNVA